jgi:hypothetical protein
MCIPQMPTLPVQRFLQRLKPEIATSFTADQLDAIDLYFCMRHKVCHAVDLRGRLKLPFFKIYFVFLAGQDQNTA